ncbi:MAG TPA: helix-turn-helix domain-containing protein [Terriglobales bacterium]|nr:helix-turn-helix domain-containing protein [Terriglobales bacterium]
MDALSRIVPRSFEPDSLFDCAIASKPHYVNEIAEKLRIEQSRVSHNLACLLNCGFVEWEWRGKSKVYRINSNLQPVLAGIEKHLANYAPALKRCKTLKSESMPVVVIASTSQSGRAVGPSEGKENEGQSLYRSIFGSRHCCESLLHSANHICIDWSRDRRSFSVL